MNDLHNATDTLPRFQSPELTMVHTGFEYPVPLSDLRKDCVNGISADDTPHSGPGCVVKHVAAA